MPTDKERFNEVGDHFECKNCGATILVERVAHPIWDGPFACSGSGQCDYEMVPYFPQCDKKPSFHGSPIKREVTF